MKNEAELPEELVVQFKSRFNGHYISISSQEEQGKHHFYFDSNGFLSVKDLREIPKAIEKYIELYDNRSVLTKRDGVEVNKKPFWRFW